MGSYKQSMIAASSFFLVLNALVLLARIFVRIKLIRAFGWDDGLLLLAFFGYVMGCIMGFISMHYGFAADAGDDPTFFDTDLTNRFYWANQFCIYLSSGIVKIAVGAVLYRLAITTRNRIILGFSIGVVAVWTGVMLVFSSGICASNPSGVSDYVSSKMCSDIGYFRMISNIFIDFFYALFPIVMLWNANLTKQMKRIVGGLLGLGVIASTATIAKLIILVKLQTAGGYEAQWLHYQLLEWAGIEVALAIFAASAAALRPLARRLAGHSMHYITDSSDASFTTFTATPGSVRASGTEASTQPPNRFGPRPSTTDGSEQQYELQTFHSKEPAPKTEEPTPKLGDEELGQPAPVKMSASVASA